MIRRPLFDQREVDRREKLICFFAENKEKREEMQIMLSKVGKTWHGSLTDTILALENAPEVKTDVYKRQALHIYIRRFYENFIYFTWL